MTSGTRITQGAFSYLPDLTDEEIAAQIAYGTARGWGVVVEHTDDPHPRNVYWDLWGLPMFDLEDPAEALAEIRRCRAAHPDRYVRVSLHDPSRGRATTALAFLVQRPPREPRLRLGRGEGAGRTIRYALHVDDGWRGEPRPEAEAGSDGG